MPRNTKKRFLAVREWGNRWSLLDRQLRVKLINQSLNRAMTEDLATHLNEVALGCQTIEEVQKHIQVTPEEIETKDLSNGSG